MRLLQPCIALFMLLSTSGIATAAVSYEFCITHQTGASLDTFGARYRFGDLDPGREAARLLVVAKTKTAATTSISASSYRKEDCGDIRDEFKVTASAEQIQQLGNAVGSGDIVSAGIVVGEIAVGITVETVEGVAKGAEKVVDWLGKRLGIRF